MASVVISDTHFGLSSSTLSNPKKVDQLIQEISGQGNSFDEIVLLGDIFDFWRVRPEKAIRDSRYFLKRLSEMDLKTRYIVGNHDHHFVVMKQESEFVERVARGDSYPIFVPILDWCQTINGLSIEMLYPIHMTRCYNRTFLFTHGHHLNGIEAISLQMMEKLRKLSGDERSPADLEMMMTYAYESIYRSSYVGEIVEFEERLWQVSGFLYKFKARALKTISGKPFKPIESQYGGILKFINDQNIRNVDCFIYGDTHHADIYQKMGGPLAMNTGSFTHEGGKSSGMETPDTYMVITEEGLALRQLGRKEPLYLCELL